MITGPFYTYRQIHFTSECFWLLIFVIICHMWLSSYVAVATWPWTYLVLCSIKVIRSAVVFSKFMRTFHPAWWRWPEVSCTRPPTSRGVSRSKHRRNHRGQFCEGSSTSGMEWYLHLTPAARTHNITRFHNTVLPQQWSSSSFYPLIILLLFLGYAPAQYSLSNLTHQKVQIIQKKTWPSKAPITYLSVNLLATLILR